LAEVLDHMKQQNDHQVSQLERGEVLINQLRSTNRRVNVLIGAAVLLIVLGGVQEKRFERIVSEQQAAQLRAMILEKSVDQKITTGTASVVKKVEELGQTSPVVVTGLDGTLSLSVPIKNDPDVSSVPPEPRAAGSKVAKSPVKTATKPAAYSVVREAGAQDRVLLPLK
jgi:hypothetical protein